MREFSDYIVFVDESGDHGLTKIDPDFSVFALAFCIIKKSDYLRLVVPAIQRFKFEYWGHDGIILHEHELRKSAGDFAFLRVNQELRAAFMNKLSGIMQEAPIKIIASVIDKEKLQKKYADPWNPYELALQFCMERALSLLFNADQRDRLVHVVFEGRGRKEDNELELVFRRICDNNSKLTRPSARRVGRRGFTPSFSEIGFEPKFLPKSVNSSGLQLADLVARPIALKTLRPDQPNRAYEIITGKLFAKKVFP